MTCEPIKYKSVKIIKKLNSLIFFNMLNIFNMEKLVMIIKGYYIQISIKTSKYKKNK